MKTKLVLWAALLCVGGFAHEGHEVPGVLPIPENGGKLVEAVPEEKPGHKHSADEKELFLEVLYKDKEIQIYPWILGGKKLDSLIAVSPFKDLKDIQVSVQLPDQKTPQVLKHSLKPGLITAPVDLKKAYRFTVIASVVHEKEKKVAEAKIEKK